MRSRPSSWAALAAAKARMPVSTLMTRRMPSAAASEALIAHAVAFAKAMGDVETDFSAHHFNGCLENDRGGCAVHVVIAVNEDGFMPAYGLANPDDGGIHAEHVVGVVEVVELGVEEARDFFAGAQAARKQQFSDNQWNAGGAGQRGCGCRIGFVVDPAFSRCDQLLVFVLVLFKNNVAEVFDGFEQVLVTVVPCCGSFVNEGHTL